MKSSRQDFFSIANIIAETKTSATAEVNPISKGKDHNSNQSWYACMMTKSLFKRLLKVKKGEIAHDFLHA